MVANKKIEHSMYLKERQGLRTWQNVNVETDQELEVMQYRQCIKKEKNVVMFAPVRRVAIQRC